MELRKLRDFIALAEVLHFERAARRVGSEQSPFSRRIRDFERDLGVQLFKRTSRGTVLSPAGTVFLPFARALVRQKEQAQRALAAASAVPHEELRIGICDEVPLKQLARLLALYRADHPALDIQIVELPCETLILDLQSGALDIGFSVGSPEEPKIEARPLWTHDAVALVQADPKSAEIEGVDICELSKSRIVLGHRQCACGTKSRIDSLLRSVAAKPSTKDAGSFNIIRMLVDAGDGVGIVSAAQAERMTVIRMRYVPLNEGEGMFTTHLLRNAETNEQHFSVLEQLARKVA